MTKESLFIEINETASESICGGSGNYDTQTYSPSIAFVNAYQEATGLSIGKGAFALAGGLLFVVASTKAS